MNFIKTVSSRSHSVTLNGFLLYQPRVEYRLFPRQRKSMKTTYYLSKKLQFEYDMPILNGNKLIFSDQKKEVTLSKNQAKLITCLLNNKNAKSDIIASIWGSGSYKSTENNYSQLIYKTRALFIREGFQADFIMTIPRYGVCLNKNNFKQKKPQKHYSINILNDYAICF